MGRLVLFAGFIIVSATAQLYYIIFKTMLVGCAALLAPFHRRSRQSLAAGLPFERLTVPKAVPAKAVAAGCILALVLFDQMPSNVPESTVESRAIIKQATVLNHQLNAQFPPNSMVFQLPIVSYPEAGNAYTLNPYSMMVPYILGDNSFRWSYGGIRGRSNDWQLNWGETPPQIDGRGSCRGWFQCADH